MPLAFLGGLDCALGDVGEVPCNISIGLHGRDKFKLGKVSGSNT